MLQRTIACSISSPTNHYPPHPIWRLTMSNKKSKLDTAADLQVEARDFAQKSVDQAQKAFDAIKVEEATLQAKTGQPATAQCKAHHQLSNGERVENLICPH